MNSQRQDSSPAAALICPTPTAMNPPTPEARAFAAWKIPIRRARSDGLYQNEKYIKHAGTCMWSAYTLTKGFAFQIHTTPDSGTPRKNRAASSPEAFLTAAIQQTTVPKATIMHGK